MSRKRKIENSSLSDHEAYLSGKMSEKERNAFEKRLEADSFEREAAEGLSSNSVSELRSDLDLLNKKVERRISGRRLPMWYRFSAAAVVLLVVASVFLVKELRRPGMVVSENLQETVQKSIIDIKTEPETDVSEIEKAAAPETEKEMDEVVKGVEVSEEAISEDIMALALFEDEIKDSLLQDRIVEVTPLARPSENNISKRSKMAEAPLSGYSDRKLIKGQVLSSDDNLPLPGTSIIIKGSTEGVVTDVNGFFEIGADSNQTLVASFVGMETKEVKVEGYELGSIILDPDMLSLDEVIVVAYGVEGRVSGFTTGAVTEIDPDNELLDYTAASPEGGMSRFRDYIEENLVFPADYTKSDREVVRIRFTVSPGRSPFGFEIVRSPGEEFSKESIRVITEGPSWNPATNNNVPLTESISLRIVFRRR